MLLTSSDTKRTLMPSILVYKFRPERTGFNIYAEYTRPQLTFLASVPWDHRVIQRLQAVSQKPKNSSEISKIDANFHCCLDL